MAGRAPRTGAPPADGDAEFVATMTIPAATDAAEAGAASSAASKAATATTAAAATAAATGGGKKKAAAGGDDDDDVLLDAAATAAAEEAAAAAAAAGDAAALTVMDAMEINEWVNEQLRLEVERLAKGGSRTLTLPVKSMGLVVTAADALPRDGGGAAGATHKKAAKKAAAARRAAAAAAAAAPAPPATVVLNRVEFDTGFDFDAVTRILLGEDAPCGPNPAFRYCPVALTTASEGAPVLMFGYAYRTDVAAGAANTRRYWMLINNRGKATTVEVPEWGDV